MNIRPFEIALIGLFAITAIAGIFFMANYQAKKSAEDLPYGEQVTIWGTFDQNVIERFLTDAATEDDVLKVVRYRRIDPRSFDSELLNAIAEGRAPDLVILPHTLLVTYRTKLQAISPETLDPQVYRDTYIDGAEIWQMSDGVYGIPFAVDPLVMYWNRDIFSAAGLASPPRTWETLVSQTIEAIVRIDDERNITQSAVAFGGFDNVEYAKDILSMLILQAGNSIVEERGDSYVVTLNDTTDGLGGGEAAFSFYTQFLSPASTLYSWNNSKRPDRAEFLAGKLGLYFGKGSDREELEKENANLNFDLAQVPQGESTTVKRNYGDFYAFAIPRSSSNIRGAFGIAMLFASPEYAKTLTDALDLAPAHRALYDGSVSEPYKQIIYQSALIARGWLDPAPAASKQIIRETVDEMTSGRERHRSLLLDAESELEALFR